MKNSENENPIEKYPQPPFEEQSQEVPGLGEEMNPRPDHGEESYQGHGLLKDQAVIITGGDSGIGKATAIAMAREGADILISYKTMWRMSMLSRPPNGYVPQEAVVSYTRGTSK